MRQQKGPVSRDFCWIPYFGARNSQMRRELIGTTPPSVNVIFLLNSRNLRLGPPTLRYSSKPGTAIPPPCGQATLDIDLREQRVPWILGGWVSSSSPCPKLQPSVAFLTRAPSLALSSHANCRRPRCIFESFQVWKQGRQGFSKGRMDGDPSEPQGDHDRGHPVRNGPGRCS